jgi:hypothetical protein
MHVLVLILILACDEPFVSCFFNDNTNLPCFVNNSLYVCWDILSPEEPSMLECNKPQLNYLHQIFYA